jgi:hypothetical protein
LSIDLISSAPTVTSSKQTQFLGSDSNKEKGGAMSFDQLAISPTNHIINKPYY